MNNQYLYCLIRSGFNDMLCQLTLAWQYAESHKRILVINARRFHFKDPLSRYFTTEFKDIFLHPGEDLLRHFDNLETYPPDLRGQCRHPPRKPMNPFSPPARSLSIDLSQAYQEDLLVHYAHGGGEFGHEWLRKMRLVPEVALEIAKALAVLGDDYDAVHIRNTDIETKYLPFFREIFLQMRGRKLLVCSDDPVCREAAKKFFVESQVLTVTDIPDTDGVGLHCYAERDVYTANLNMLTDLLALARARRLFITKATGKSKAGEFSGFSFLARCLHNHPEIVDNLFTSLPPEFPFAGSPVPHSD